MLTEREIEEKLKEKFAKLFDTSDNAPSIIGAWDVTQPGEVKGRGDASTSVIAVAVGLRNYASFCTPQADFPCTAVLSIRREAAPTGAALADFIEPLMNLMHVWNEDYDDVLSDLATNTFTPGGFQLADGSLTQSSDGWIVNINFTLRGVVNVMKDTSITITET